MNIEKAKTPVKKFETGKWYVCHLNERPSSWNSNGEMDGLLDGKPHKCIMGYETDASFEDIPFPSDGGWCFYCNMDYFEEVPAPNAEIES